VDIETLKKFCGTKENIKVPYSRDNFTYVTNGHLILKLPLIDCIIDNPKAPLLSGLKSDFLNEPTKWYPCPDIPEIKGIKCSVCDGTGIAYCCPECEGDGHIDFSTDYNYYGEEDCITCDGNGCISRKEIDEIITARPYIESIEQECSACYGTGIEYAIDKSIEVGPALFSDRYLSWLNLFPNCEIGPFDDKKPARIRFDGGEGLIMPRVR